MAEVVFAVPVLPGKEEPWRRLNQELSEVRGEEHAGLMERLGVRGYRVWLARLPGGNVAVARVEADDPDKVLERLAGADDPFARWFKERLREFHGGCAGQEVPRSKSELISIYPEEEEWHP